MRWIHSILTVVCLTFALHSLASDRGGGENRGPRDGRTIAAANDVLVISANSGPNEVDVLSNDFGWDIYVVGVSSAQHGTLTLTEDGGITYEPDQDYVGNDSFGYTVIDGSGSFSFGSVQVIVQQEAELVLDTIVISLDNNSGETYIDILGELGYDDLTITSVGDPISGTTSLDQEGAINYTPAHGFVGIDSFTYEVIDFNGSTATGTVIVNVSAGVSHAPVAIADFQDIGANSDATEISVLDNDYGDNLLVTSVGNASHGTTDLSVDGVITYQPNTDFTGLDFFTYEITGDNNATSSATVYVFVRPAIPLIANTDVAFIDQNSDATEIGVLDNDIGDGLTVVSTTDGKHGVVGIVEDYAVSYTPKSGYIGKDSFTYTVTDQAGHTATATVLVFVQPIPDVGVNVDFEIVFANSKDNEFEVLGNDVGPLLTITQVNAPAHGTATLTPDQTILYTPTADFTGNDTFTYTVTGSNNQTATGTIQVLVIDAPPLIANADFAELSYNDTDTEIYVLDNDYGSNIIVTAVSAAAHGTATLSGEGTVIYSPNTNFSGSDTFTYTVADDKGHSATATVFIIVDPLIPLILSDDYTEVPANSADNYIGVLDNDLGDNLVIDSITSAQHGTATLDENGEIYYTPDNGYVGLDTFDYTVLDADNNPVTATVTISVLPNSPLTLNDDEVDVAIGSGSTLIDVLSNDYSDFELSVTSVTQPSHGIAALDAEGNVTYAPADGYSGDDSFTYTVADSSGATGTAIVYVFVHEPLPLIVNDDTVWTKRNSLDVEVNVLENDCGEDLVVTAVGKAANGSATLVDGVVLYTPNTKFVGSDSFTYSVTDALGRTGTATVYVEVFGPPVAATDTFTVYQNSRGIILNVLSNDTGPALFITDVTDAESGFVEIGDDNTLLYSAPADFVGTDTFNYVINDANDSTAIGTVTIHVIPIPGTIAVNASGSPLQIKPGDSVSFTSAGSSKNHGDLNYAWDFGDGSSDDGQDVSHVYSTAGTYTATVTVTDLQNQTASSSVVVVVADPTSGAGFTTSDLVGQVGVPLVFNALGKGKSANASGKKFDWSFGDGNGGSGGIVSKTYDMPGDYKVSVSITDGTGSKTAQRTIHVLPKGTSANAKVGYKFKALLGKNPVGGLSLAMSIPGGTAAAGTKVAFLFEGARFDGTLNAKLSDSTNKNVKWNLKSNSKTGVLSLVLKISKTNLGAGLNALVQGATVGQTLTPSVPIHVEIGSQIYEIAVPSSMTLGKDGKSLSGGGNGP
ncbi:MAG: Ig-like domain-containing protein [Planctomycetota bacterium]